MKSAKEIHQVWVKGSAENTWYPLYTTSKEEVVMQMRENIAKERSLEQHLSVLLSTCEGMSNRADAEAEKSVLSLLKEQDGYCKS